MKTLNTPFDDKEFNEMSHFKKELSWRTFILRMYNYCKISFDKGEFDLYEKTKTKK